MGKSRDGPVFQTRKTEERRPLPVRWALTPLQMIALRKRRALIT
jgi:hypothetical protein